jgi:hypothetical protein
LVCCLSLQVLLQLLLPRLEPPHVQQRDARRRMRLRVGVRQAQLQRTLHKVCLLLLLLLFMVVGIAGRQHQQADGLALRVRGQVVAVRGLQRLKLQAGVLRQHRRQLVCMCMCVCLAWGWRQFAVSHHTGHAQTAPVACDLCVICRAFLSWGLGRERDGMGGKRARTSIPIADKHQ